MTKAERQEELDAVKMVAQEIMGTMPSHPTGFNWGFLWCTAVVDGKRFKMLLGSACPADWHELELAVRKVKEIDCTWVNMD
jgi:hypothetical protein